MRVAETVDERARESRLSGADRAREQSELLLFDRVLEPCQRLPVLRAFVEVFRVRRLTERSLTEAEEFAEHDQPATRV